MLKLSRILLVAFAAVALIAAGCGGDTEEKNDYVDQVNKAQTEFADQVTKLSTAITSTSSSSTDQKTIESYQTAVDGVVKDLEGITPPEDVKAEHQQLVDAMSTYGESVGTALEDLQGGSAQDRLKAATELQTASSTAGTQINQAIEAINKKLQE
ncbi:hypothetical protein LRS13_08455 [Svornostia abyssi]|uniref:Apolipophorin-III n=1 Tax=Svornostia abyssi TaxID=2898438 RepID=A0ABY5PLV3_9ACTN|nr:hypothetical protein LRS13_08455 [Parviterribacteraceae bacterium J379]